MEKITKEEAHKLLSKSKYGKTQIIMDAIRELGVGEFLLVKKEEWPVKTPLTIIISQSFRATRSDKKFKARTLNNQWLVERLK